MIFFGTHAKRKPGAPAAELVLWDPKLFLYVTFGTIGVVAVGSLYKTAVLAKGGSAVAESLGGRLVDSHTTRPDERQLRNVIEEIAIAAGVPVPEIYVLDDGKGINTALDRFALAAPQIKKQLMEACVQVVGADGFIQEREAELHRAIADTLDCPIPPFVEIADS